MAKNQKIQLGELATSEGLLGASWYFEDDFGGWQYQDGVRVIQLEENLKKNKHEFNTSAQNWTYVITLKKQSGNGDFEGTQRNQQTGRVRKIKRVVLSEVPTDKNAANITQNQIQEVAGYDFAAHQRLLNVAPNVRVTGRKNAPFKPKGKRQAVPKRAITIKKNKSKKNKETYGIYIYRVLKQVHPNLGVSKKAMAVMNQFMSDVFERIATEASIIARQSKKRTLSQREIQTAVKLTLNGNTELCKHATSEGVKALNKFNSH